MPDPIVTIESRNRIATVRFDRKRESNPLSYRTLIELTEAARSLEDVPDIDVVVLTGREGVFTAGIDLKDPEAANFFTAPVGEKRRRAALGPKMCRAWETLPQVTIAAIEGYCLGGGVSLAVSCDFRVMAEGARLCVPELRLGMNMSWQTLPRLTNLVGPARAKRIVILAEMFGAGRALDWGLADWIVKDGQAMDESVKIAETIAAMPSIPVRMTKASINAHANALSHAVSHMDGDQFTLTTLTRDHEEGIAAFLEKRPPVFKGE